MERVNLENDVQMISITINLIMRLIIEILVSIFYSRL